MQINFWSMLGVVAAIKTLAKNDPKAFGECLRLTELKPAEQYMLINLAFPELADQVRALESCGFVEPQATLALHQKIVSQEMRLFQIATTGAAPKDVAGLVKHYYRNTRNNEDDFLLGMSRLLGKVEQNRAKKAQ